MGNFEKLSVLVIVVIIVMILVVALYTWTEDPNAGAGTATADKVAEVGSAPNAPAVAPDKPPARVLIGDSKPSLVGPSNAAPARPGDFSSVLNDLIKPRTPGPAIDPVLQEKPTVDPASVKPVEPRYYTVRAGDSFAKIAKATYPGMVQRGIDELIKANPTIEPTRMREGQRLVLPELAAATPQAPGTPGPAIVRPSTPTAELRPGTVYVVRQGDTLPGISKRAYDSTGRWQDIWIENFGAIDDPDHLKAGTRLKLPK